MEWWVFLTRVQQISLLLTYDMLYTITNVMLAIFLTGQAIDSVFSAQSLPLDCILLVYPSMHEVFRQQQSLPKFELEPP